MQRLKYKRNYKNIYILNKLTLFQKYPKSRISDENAFHYHTFEKKIKKIRTNVSPNPSK